MIKHFVKMMSCLAIAVLLAACTNQSPPPGQAVTSAPPMPANMAPATLQQQPPPELAAEPFSWEPSISKAGGICTVGQAASLGGKEGRLQSLEIGFGPRGGLIAWPMDEARAQLIPINGDGTVTEIGSVVEITSASNLNEVLALGDSFMLATHAVCPDKKFFFKCLHLRLLDSRGKALGNEIKSVTREWLGKEIGARLSDTEVRRMRSFMYIPPALASFSLQGQTLSVDEPAELKGLGEIVNVEAFTVVGDKWYAVFNDEAGDGGRVFVSSDGAKTPMTKPLGSSGWAKALASHEDKLALLYQVGDNPKKHGRMAYLDVGGDQVSKPIMIRAEGQMPEPFADDMSVDLSVKKKELWMVRRDAAGREVGEAVKVGIGLRGDRDEAPYDIAWTGDRFVVTYATIEGGQWRFYAAPVTCSGLAY